MKLTQKKRKEFMREQLGANPAWALRGLVRIYDYQTREEQSMGDTKEYNGVGFSGIDGYILSSLAEQYQRRGFLSQKQMNLLHRKMPKYWKQLLAISDLQKFDSLLIAHV